MKLLKALALAAALAAGGPSLAAAQNLVVSIGPRGYGEVVPHAIAEFEKANPGIKIEWLRVSDVPNETRKIYVTNLMAGSATPDVFAVDIIWPGEFIERGWLHPLNELIPQERRSQWLKSFVDAATVKGVTYAAPLYTDGIHLFYRKDLLEKYGFQPPATWEDLIEQSKAILKGENNRQLYGFTSMWAPIEGLFMNYLGFLGGAGGSFFDKDGKLAITSPQSVKALGTMVDMLHTHRIAPDSILNARPDDARTLFQQGRAAFLMVQSFVHPPLTAPDSPVADKVGFTRVPYFEGNPEGNTTPVGGWLLGINPNSANKEAAAKLVSFMTGPEMQLWAAVNAARAPGNTAVYDHPEFAQSKGPLKDFSKHYAFGVARPSAETGQRYPRVSEIMQTEVTNALHRRKTPGKALADAAREIQALLK